MLGNIWHRFFGAFYNKSMVTPPRKEVPLRTPEECKVARDLTPEERSLGEWLLKNGEKGADKFLDQLERAKVVALCPCGCASIDFRVEGLPEPVGGLHPLGDFVFGDESTDDLGGVFIFEQNGVLGGIEVYTFCEITPTIFPKPSELRPF
ncbi:MAG: hypothetical protein IPK98_09370 [Chloracidobacterium sp.]|nr:hypothetical protein [Chloracidobacterium sp.]